MTLTPNECMALRDSLIYLSNKQQKRIEEVYDLDLNKVFTKLESICHETASTTGV